MIFKSSFKPALDCESKVFTHYKIQIQIQNELLAKIRSTLPDHLACHALYCVVSGKRISLYTDSSAWSSQLRFYHQTMLQGLSTSIRRNFEEIKIKIIPKTIENKTKEENTIPSAINIDLILNHAENQTDKKLKQSLSNLAKTLKKLSK